MEKNGFEETSEKLVNWIKKEWEQRGFSRAVLGISGGKDSTVCAALLVKALGADNVYGLSMPDSNNAEIDADTKAVMEATGLVHLNVVPLGDIHNLFRMIYTRSTGEAPSAQAEINVMPRERMKTLYYHAQSIGNALVVNTSNLSEVITGYGTIWGDYGTGDISLLGLLFVSEVIGIGEALGLPQTLTRKPPADGLTGKTDEENLGFEYQDVENLFKKLSTWEDYEGDTRSLLPYYVSSEVDYILQNEDQRLSETDKLVLERIKRNNYKFHASTLPTFDPEEEEEE